ncbi:DUF488 domain-containing protein [Compostibacter hankyongensis]|uniref:DUF488 domain-containing protein n=1 Tax=Compostibacter hankyongensis TaxID=1007089 RepID=A0ABP8FM93_9BACT
MPSSKASPPAGGIIYTIGHSTHDTDTFIGMLKAYDIACLADIRTLPGSRRVPQFNREQLEPALEKAGIYYVHLKALGGLRHTTAASVNTGWRNKSFRGYADYMQTAAFAEALQELMKLAASRTTVMMCAEAVPWRCHRSLVGDALLVKGWQVIDIFSATHSAPHTLTTFARVEDGVITYPGPV